MNVNQVTSEMERLIPGKWTWAVEEVGSNTFKTNFPSKSEMLRMINWGTIQSKDRQAKLVIEERSGGSHFKHAMSKVWVQMTGLPSELRDFNMIWAIGTILGVTKDVDMKFTREHDRARLQVLVLDPSIIPQSVDVVIGEFVYELHFRIEPEELQDRPEPMDMDDNGMDDQANGGTDEANETTHMQADIHSQKDTKGDSATSSKSGDKSTSQHGKKTVYHFPVLEMTQELSLPDLQNINDVVADSNELLNSCNNTGGDAQISEPGSHRVHAIELAAIPEVATPGRRSKRRAKTAVEVSLDRAERLKAAHNLDFTSGKGNT
jgi:hypothetical protein